MKLRGYVNNGARIKCFICGQRSTEDFYMIAADSDGIPSGLQSHHMNAGMSENVNGVYICESCVEDSMSSGQETVLDEDKLKKANRKTWDEIHDEHYSRGT